MYKELPKEPQEAPECISEYLKSQTFLGGMPPDPPSKVKQNRTLKVVLHYLQEGVVSYCPSLKVSE